ncbi:hypothetical protein AB0H43_13330 [Hamadaea sp. NPDC050747]|uniref:hypothetical protein n=1 Tax=Hamadaea sp. NPDC050747 TaxID=3155789 RepID=UPI003406B507
MLAFAILVISLAADASGARISSPSGRTAVELAAPEIRRLINAALAKPVRPSSVLVWSVWRRHQAQAKTSRYKRRAMIENAQPRS